MVARYFPVPKSEILLIKGSLYTAPQLVKALGSNPSSIVFCFLVVVWYELSLFSWILTLLYMGYVEGTNFSRRHFSFKCGENVPITPGIYPEGLNKQQNLLETMPS